MSFAKTRICIKKVNGLNFDYVLTLIVYWVCEMSLFTWGTLYEVGHHGTEVSSNVFENLHVFVILSFQKHPGQVHILKKESAQGQRITFQSSISAERQRDEDHFMFSSL